MQPTTFVTVSHEIDFELLKIQARSFDLYLGRSMIEQIIVIENFTPGKRHDWRGELLDHYGSLAPLVRFVRSGDLVAMPRAAGWWTQQVLKLVIAREISTDWYVTFDAKNHLVYALEASYLCSEDGRPATKLRGYRTDIMLETLLRVLAYKGLNPEHFVDNWMPTNTPFTLITRAVRHLIADVEHREQAPFARVFLERKLSEYFLYAAHLIASGVPHRDAYSNTLEVAPVIWPEMALSVNQVQKAILSAKLRQTPVFGVHRRAIDKMPFTCLSLIADFWAQRSLFRSRPEALEALERIKHAESLV